MKLRPVAIAAAIRQRDRATRQSSKGRVHAEQSNCGEVVALQGTGRAPDKSLRRAPSGQ